MAKKELDPDLGEAGTISSSMGDINYQYDEANDNYIVDISFARGGSAEYVLDSDTISELDAKGGAFYNSSIRGQM
jgi:hypothetical protein